MHQGNWNIHKISLKNTCIVHERNYRFGKLWMDAHNGTENVEETQTLETGCKDAWLPMQRRIFRTDETQRRHSKVEPWHTRPNYLCKFYWNLNHLAMIMRSCDVSHTSYIKAGLTASISWTFNCRAALQFSWCPARVQYMQLSRSFFAHRKTRKSI